VRIQGAAGYMQEHRWERYLREVIATQCAAGHQDTLLRGLAERAVLDLEMRALRAKRL
jgi:alkylation response protein AidB-like acyl-CoA dehydrogenase